MTISKYFFLIGPRDPHTDWYIGLVWMWAIGWWLYQRLFKGEAAWNVLGAIVLLLACVSKLDSFVDCFGCASWILVRFFLPCRLLFELSDEWFRLFNGWVIWEEFGFEGTMVMTRVSLDVIEVFTYLRGMLWLRIRSIHTLWKWVNRGFHCIKNHENPLRFE